MDLTAGVEALMKSGKWDEAREETVRLLVTYPTNALLNSYLGLCHFRAGQYAEAVPALERAVALDPRFVDAGVKLAQAYDRLGRFHECAVTARQFLPLRPGDHTLQGLLEFHGCDLSLDREGWEKSEWIPAHRARLSNR